MITVTLYSVLVFSNSSCARCLLRCAVVKMARVHYCVFRTAGVRHKLLLLCRLSAVRILHYRCTGIIVCADNVFKTQREASSPQSFASPRTRFLPLFHVVCCPPRFHLKCFCSLWERGSCSSAFHCRCLPLSAVVCSVVRYSIPSTHLKTQLDISPLSSSFIVFILSTFQVYESKKHNFNRWRGGTKSEGYKSGRNLWLKLKILH